MSLSHLTEDQFKPYLNTRVNDIRVDGTLTVSGSVDFGALELFNPTLQEKGGNVGTWTLVSRNGKRYRFGKLVFVWAEATYNVTGANDTNKIVQMGGLTPTASGGDSTMSLAIVSDNLDVGITQYAKMLSSATQADFYKTDTTTNVPIKTNAPNFTIDVRVWGVYTVGG